MAGATALMGQHHRRSGTRQLASQSPRTPVENCCREGSKLAATSPAPPQGTFATGRSPRAPRHPWERHRVRLRAVGSQPWQAVNAAAPPAPGSTGAIEAGAGTPAWGAPWHLESSGQPGEQSGESSPLSLPGRAGAVGSAGRAAGAQPQSTPGKQLHSRRS